MFGMLTMLTMPQVFLITSIVGDSKYVKIFFAHHELVS